MRLRVVRDVGDLQRERRVVRERDRERPVALRGSGVEALHLRDEQPGENVGQIHRVPRLRGLRAVDHAHLTGHDRRRRDALLQERLDEREDCLCARRRAVRRDGRRDLVELALERPDLVGVLVGREVRRQPVPGVGGLAVEGEPVHVVRERPRHRARRVYASVRDGVGRNDRRRGLAEREVLPRTEQVELGDAQLRVLRHGAKRLGAGADRDRLAVHGLLGKLRPVILSEVEDEVDAALADRLHLLLEPVELDVRAHHRGSRGGGRRDGGALRVRHHACDARRLVEELHRLLVRQDAALVLHAGGGDLYEIVRGVVAAEQRRVPHARPVRAGAVLLRALVRVRARGPDLERTVVQREVARDDGRRRRVRPAHRLETARDYSFASAKLLDARVRVLLRLLPRRRVGGLRVDVLPALHGHLRVELRLRVGPNEPLRDGPERHRVAGVVALDVAGDDRDHAGRGDSDLATAPRPPLDGPRPRDGRGKRLGEQVEQGEPRVADVGRRPRERDVGLAQVARGEHRLRDVHHVVPRCGAAPRDLFEHGRDVLARRHAVLVQSELLEHVEDVLHRGRRSGQHTLPEETVERLRPEHLAQRIVLPEHAAERLRDDLRVVAEALDVLEQHSGDAAARVHDAVAGVGVVDVRLRYVVEGVQDVRLRALEHHRSETPPEFRHGGPVLLEHLRHLLAGLADERQERGRGGLDGDGTGR